jgi:hypothetical protein
MLLGNALNIEELKGKLLVKDSKNWFTIEDGKVKVEEFDYAVKDLKMKIAGSLTALRMKWIITSRLRYPENGWTKPA